jgi:hypothetical protein
MEKRYKDGCTVNMMADYCWMLMRKSTCVESCGRSTTQEISSIIGGKV